MPVNKENVTVTAVPPDKKCSIAISNSTENVVPLHMGETKIVVTVGSVDGTNTKVKR